MAAAAVHPVPTSPPPARRVVAPWVRNRLAVAAAAVVCLFLASMWILFGGLITVEVGGLACGQDCPVVLAASKVVNVVAVTLVLLLRFSVLLSLMLMVRVAEAATDIEAATTFAAVAREELRDPIIQAYLASLLFVLVLTVGSLLKDTSPVKGSRQERMGSILP
ncbi:hypothetical protein HU200_033382 [Digitaria exilis]|uniref:Uncharacterized protein n=1 Tax=Digitaria exilis TaxID=1010633 RepID=A0A835BMY1_9POAL|nr:hypothetical protein HU200_033382 [Digitaria exilis]